MGCCCSKKKRTHIEVGKIITKLRKSHGSRDAADDYADIEQVFSGARHVSGLVQMDKSEFGASIPMSYQKRISEGQKNG